MNAIATASTLCNECRGIVFDDVAGDADGWSSSSTPWARTDTYPDLPIFSTSAQAGCTFCKYLCFFIQKRLTVQLKNKITAATGKQITVKLKHRAYDMRSEVAEYSHYMTELTDDTYNNEKDGIWRLKLEFESEAWPHPWRQVAMVYQGDANVSELLGISLRMPPSDALDPACINLLKKWLRTCDDEHTKCQASGPRSLPTRLLDVGDTGNSVPRLVPGASLHESMPYIALSYCWGLESPAEPYLKTTKDTFSQHQLGIPTSIMPATLRDLVFLARRLGIRYLWIDALCIIQGDPVDWENEAAAMFSVYRNAHLTVVAAAGDSSHSGFLSRTKVEPYAIVPFQSRKKGIRVSGTYLLSSLDDVRTWDADLPTHVRTRTWATRGWTFQEDIMSTRVLYFDDKTSFFRCQTERRLEHNENTYTNVRGWHALFLPPAASSSPEEKEKKREHLYATWRALVGQYTQRQLTYGDDKFPAISGLARSFSPALDDEYVAGLWRGDLLRGMFWATTFEASKPATWRAPSWSWAAWQGEIDWDMNCVKPFVSQCTTREVHAVPTGVDTFGGLKDGWIVLSASLYPVTLRLVIDPLYDDKSFPVDVMHSNGVVAAKGSIDAATPSGYGRDGTWKPIEASQLSGIVDVVAVVLALACIPDGEPDERKFSPPSFPIGLLVTQTNDVDKTGLSVYKRVGVFRTESLKQANLWVDHSQKWLKLV
ncbi:hypothetical protein PT974_04062 [Cladobotryum mycophilum]|uniref:Heterokaryon incompatibility domain-containing protein n=1 Tax=Cladobotryum mycophilum TaxID=491253 RepID=A0ABR0SV76_9HYPO